MLGVRGGSLLLVAVFLILGLNAIASEPHNGPGGSSLQSGQPCSSVKDNDRMETITLLGGEVTLPVDIEAGDRFLELVEPPVVTRTEQARMNPELQPGDGGDEGLLALERRNTDYSYMKEEWTGGMCLHQVTGSPDLYLCVCDAKFVMTNDDGLDPTRPIDIFESKYIWVDNLTVFGGAVDFLWSQEIIVSNSQFVDSGGVGGFFSENGFVHNISVIMQRPPTNMIHHPAVPGFVPAPVRHILQDLLDEGPIPMGREFMCWPHVDPPPCQGGGVFLSGGENWTVEWSHFHGAGGAGTETDTRDITIRHNTFRDTSLGVSGGNNEISWNLLRGNHLGSTSMFGWATGHDTLSYHNNSLINTFKLDHGVPGINANPGLWVERCEECGIRDNDFIGYGIPDYSSLFSSGSELNYPALLAREDNQITAHDNYWGTIHDPRFPEDLWIRITHPEQTTLELDSWETEPIHEISLMITVDHRDAPYWIERLSGFPAQEAFDELPLPE